MGIDEGLPKTKSEFLVLGKNMPNDPDAEQQTVKASVGNISKALTVYPKRYWCAADKKQPIKTAGKLESIWLDHHNTYGSGQFETDKQASNSAQVIELPPVELSGHPQKELPGSFAPIPMHWPSRQKLFGKITPENQGFIPDDTHPDFFQQAPKDQQSSQPFQAGDPYCITGMSANQISGNLPNYVVRVFSKSLGKVKEQPTVLDGIIFFPNINIGLMIYRSVFKIKTWDGKEIDAYVFAIDHSEKALQQPQSHYADEINKRRSLTPEITLSLTDNAFLPQYLQQLAEYR